MTPCRAPGHSQRSRGAITLGPARDAFGAALTPPAERVRRSSARNGAALLQVPQPAQPLLDRVVLVVAVALLCADGERLGLDVRRRSLVQQLGPDGLGEQTSFEV